MIIFGSIGIVVTFINMSSTGIVLMRTIIGSLFLILILLITRKTINWKNIIKNRYLLIVSGALLGGSWALLFESYNYTSVSIAILLYYTAPIIVFIISIFLFKEKLNKNKILGMLAVIIGMIIINGVSRGEGNDKLGIIFALGSAVLYSMIIILNKFLKGLSGLEITISQLIIAGIIMFIYVIIKNDKIFIDLNKNDIILVVVIGVIHTGIACYFYFDAIQKLPGQTIAILSYIDPLSALIFAAIFLSERMTIPQMIGALLIIGGNLIGQVERKVKL
ncbi:MAG TPA: EamA family transporter [Clostridiales bacterium]|nr:EamA family transporter [Clostridiales bacterium]